MSARIPGLATLRRMPLRRLLVLLSLLLAVAVQADDRAALAAGKGIRLVELDGAPHEGGDAWIAPGLHVLRFESTATVEPLPGRSSRVIREHCEARFRARPGGVYVLTQEVVARRGVRSWHHALASFVYDEGRERAVGECVCRTAPPEDDLSAPRFPSG